MANYLEAKVTFYGNKKKLREFEQDFKEIYLIKNEIIYSSDLLMCHFFNKKNLWNESIKPIGDEKVYLVKYEELKEAVELTLHSTNMSFEMLIAPIANYYGLSYVYEAISDDHSLCVNTDTLNLFYDVRFQLRLKEYQEEELPLIEEGVQLHKKLWNRFKEVTDFYSFEQLQSEMNRCFNATFSTMEEVIQQIKKYPFIEMLYYKEGTI